MKLSSVSAKTKIRHNNDVNKTFSGMPLASRRVIFLVLAQIDSKKVLPRDAEYRIYANDYAKICGIDSSTAYKQLKAATEHLQTQVLKIPKSELLAPFARAGEPLWKRPEGKGIRMLNITEYCDYEQDSGYIDVSFTKQMEPYISKLAGNYTSQVLLSAARLRDSHASNLYQLIRQNISQGKPSYFDIEVNKLKEHLGLYVDAETYNYPLFKDFNRQVLKRNFKSIMDITELKNIEAEIIVKHGRKAHKLRVSYEINSQMDFNAVLNG